MENFVLERFFAIPAISRDDATVTIDFPAPVDA
jgi:hypothetical protein